LGGLNEVLFHMQKLGFTPTQKNRPACPVKRLCKKVWAQCYSLGRPVPAYADGIAKQMFGIEKLVWCDHDQLRAITTALAKQQDREGAETR
jgi:phage gp16-like protein